MTGLDDCQPSVALVWHKCKDELPGNKMPVLCTDGRAVFIARYNGECDEWYAYDKPYQFEVAAWMPILLP